MYFQEKSFLKKQPLPQYQMVSKQWSLLGCKTYGSVGLESLLTLYNRIIILRSIF